MLTMKELVASAAARCPDRIALVDGVPDADRRRRWTYRELELRGQRIAAALLERFEPGDHVALWASNSAEWVFFQIGAGLAGLVLVTVNPAYRHAELAHVLRQSRARGLYFEASYRGRNLEEIAIETAASIPAVTVLERLDESDRAGRSDRFRGRAPRGPPGRHRTDSVHVRDDWRAKGGDALTRVDLGELLPDAHSSRL